MGDPSAHEARQDAARSGSVVGSEVDRVEHAIFADLDGDDEVIGAWLWGAVDPV